MKYVYFEYSFIGRCSWWIAGEVFIGSGNGLMISGSRHWSESLLTKIHAAIWHHYSELTHLPLVPYICVNESGQHWFRQWLGAYSVPSHYQNHSGLLFIRPSGTNFDEIQIEIKTFIDKNASEYIVRKMAAIFPRERGVNTHSISGTIFTRPEQINL